jgi:hypothetical protein
MPIGFNDVVIFSAGGIVGYLGRQLLEHKLAIIRNFETIKATEFNKAASEFRAAFVDAIFALRNNARYGKKRAGDIVMEPVVIAHEKAKIMFEPFVPASELASFNAIWEKYRYGERNQTEENQDNPALRKELSQIYLNHIDELLKFAKKG